MEEHTSLFTYRPQKPKTPTKTIEKIQSKHNKLYIVKLTQFNYIDYMKGFLVQLGQKVAFQTHNALKETKFISTVNENNIHLVGRKIEQSFEAS